MASTFQKRMLIGHTITLALMAVTLVWAVANLVVLGQASDAILRENYKSILAAENMIDAIERQDSATLLVMLDYGPEGLAQFRENETHFLQWLGRAKDNITIPGEAEIVASIEGGYSAYLVDFSRLREMKASSPQQAGEFYHETVLPSFIRVRDEAIRLREINQATMFSASRRAENLAQAAIWSTAVVGVVAVILGMGFSLLLSRRLVRPIRQMMAATDALADGNYDVCAPTDGPAELARLGEAFNAMAGKLGVYHRMNVEQIVAEKRKSEAVLRSIEDGVVVVDAAFRISDMNPQAGRVFEVDPEAALGKHFLEVVRDEQLFELMKGTGESGQPPVLEEGKNILTIGERERARHYLFAITPVESKGGAMLGVVLLLRDVTHLKELDRLKSEFVMTASHELKTPLQSLGMSVELLREGPPTKLDDRQRQLLDAAAEELARLKSLISDLLDLSRIEAGRLELDFDHVSPRLLADKAAGVLEAQVHEGGLALSVDVPPDVGEVRADVNKITWVLTNLIANALRYARARITVSGRRAGAWIHLSVSDDGVGIAPEDRSRIFDKFVQVRDGKSAGGTGLGLAICREIIRAHKGTIWLDSAAGKGSTFTFALPAAQAP